MTHTEWAYSVLLVVLIFAIWADVKRDLRKIMERMGVRR